MTKILKDNAILIIGALVPCLVIGYFVASAAIPKILTERPKYSFLYYEEGYRGNREFENKIYIEDGKIKAKYRLVKNRKGNYSYHHASRLFFYNSKTEELREIPLLADTDESHAKGKWYDYDLPDLSELTLQATKRSPDGFTVEINGYRSRGIFQELFVGSQRRRGLYIAKNGVASTVVDTHRYYYSGNFRFLGWIVNDESEVS